MAATIFRFVINFIINIFSIILLIKIFGYENMGSYSYSNLLLTIFTFSQPASLLWFNKNMRADSVTDELVFTVHFYSLVFFVFGFLLGFLFLKLNGTFFEIVIFSSLAAYNLFIVLSSTDFSNIYLQKNLLYANALDVIRSLLPLLVLIIFYFAKINLCYLIILFTIAGSFYLLFVVFIVRINSLPLLFLYIFSLHLSRALKNSSKLVDYFNICYGAFGYILKDSGFFFVLKPVTNSLEFADVTLINRFASIGRQGFAFLQFFYLREELSSFDSRLVTRREKAIVRTKILVLLYFLFIFLFLIFQPLITSIFGYQNLNFKVFIYFSILILFEVLQFFLNMFLTPTILFTRLQKNSNILLSIYFISLAFAYLFHISFDFIFILQILFNVFSFLIIYINFLRYDDTNPNMYIQ